VANEKIAEAHPIRANVLPREEAFQIPDLIRTQINLLPPSISEIRIIDIEGVDLQADGGLHVANTREIGRLRVTKTENKGKINKRMEIVLE
jgi:misacylated tRNA(Ala) deacylase